MQHIWDNSWIRLIYITFVYQKIDVIFICNGNRLDYIRFQIRVTYKFDIIRQKWAGLSKMHKTYHLPWFQLTTIFGICVMGGASNPQIQCVIF